jgi:hypothetical protein
MTKEVQMVFRVESELRASFTKAAEREHRPAAQVLRELMRIYVDQSQQRQAKDRDKDLISAAERRRRESAVNFARASVGLEGFKISAEDEALVRRYIDGEVEISEILKAAREQAQAR